MGITAPIRSGFIKDLKYQDLVSLRILHMPWEQESSQTPQNYEKYGKAFMDQFNTYFWLP